MAGPRRSGGGGGIGNHGAVIRASICSHRTTLADIERLSSRVREIGQALDGHAGEEGTRKQDGYKAEVAAS